MEKIKSIQDVENIINSILTTIKINNISSLAKPINKNIYNTTLYKDNNKININLNDNTIPEVNDDNINIDTLKFDYNEDENKVTITGIIDNTNLNSSKIEFSATKTKNKNNLDVVTISTTYNNNSQKNYYDSISINNTTVKISSFTRLGDEKDDSGNIISIGKITSVTLKVTRKDNEKLYVITYHVFTNNIILDLYDNINISYNIEKDIINIKILNDDIDINISNDNYNFLKDNLQNVQLFSKISKNTPHYYPIKFSIDNNDYIRIKNNHNYIINNIYIGSKRQFFYKRYDTSTIADNENNGKPITYKITLDPETFKTAWNEKNFLIFLNGYLINNNNFIFNMPNFDNKLTEKEICSTIPIEKDSILDIFYIESDDDFHSIPLASYNNINHILYIAKYSDQTVIDIPYPGLRFKKINTHKEFYVFNKSGKYLKPALDKEDIDNNNYDYIISQDGNYIILTDENRLTRINSLKKFSNDTLYFIFPNISLPEDLKNITDKNINQISDIQMINTIAENSSTILTFEYEVNNVKQNYKIKKENILLFDIDDGYIIPYENFEIQKNYPKLLDPITINDITNENKPTEVTIQREQLKLILKPKDNLPNTGETHTYSIYLFKDTSEIQANPISFYIDTQYAIENNQKIFKINPIYKQYLPFILFHNNKILNKSYYTINEIDNYITINKAIEIKDKIQFLYIIPRILYNIHTQFIEIMDIGLHSDITLNNILTVEDSYNFYMTYIDGNNYPIRKINREIKKYSDNHVQSISNFLFFINGINIPCIYINKDTNAGRLWFNKKDEKFKSILTKIVQSVQSRTEIDFTILYLKDNFIIDQSISQYMSNENYINIQFEEIKLTVQ